MKMTKLLEAQIAFVLKQGMHHHGCSTICIIIFLDDCCAILETSNRLKSLRLSVD